MVKYKLVSQFEVAAYAMDATADVPAPAASPWHWLLLSSAVFMSFLPMLLVVSFSIWVPAAVIWETFAVHYTALPIRAEEYHFIGNAMFFTEFYAYLPSFFVHFCLSGVSDFDRFQIYALMLLAIHGLVMSGVFALVLKKHFSMVDKVCLVACGILPSYIQTDFINFLQINYMVVAPPFLVGALYLMISLKNNSLTMTPGRVILWGFISAFVIGTKITYVALFLPCVAVAILFAVPDRVQRWRQFAIYVSWTAIFSAVLFTGYILFQLRHVPRFVCEMADVYTSAWANQQVPFLFHHVRVWVEWDSAFQEMALLWAAALAYVLLTSFKQASRQLRIYGGVTVAMTALHCYFLVCRTAGNTFCDTFAFLTFGICLAASSVYSAPTRAGRLCSGCLILGLVWIAVFQTFAIFDAPGWLRTLKRASATCREIQVFIEAHDDLPIVYYIGERAPRQLFTNAMFPSVYLYPLMTDHQERSENYLRRFQPGTSYRFIDDGMLTAPHVIVASEYLSVPEDVQMPRADVEIFTPGSAFEQARADAQNEVKVWELERGVRDFRLHGQSKVTIVVKRH